MMRRGITVPSILDVLTRKYDLERENDRVLPRLFITSKLVSITIYIVRSFTSLC